MDIQKVQAYAGLLATLGTVAVQVVPVLFTTIDAITHSVEVSFPNATGAQKLQAALTKAEALFGDAVKVAPSVFEGLINASVAVFNAYGIFKHAKDGASSPSPSQT